MEKNKVAVLFLAHFVSDSNIKKYAKLKKDLQGKCDVFWAFQVDSKNDYSALKDMDVNFYPFDIEKLNELDYTPMLEGMYGSEHFVMECFRHEYPHYEYYWCIEYDVVFTGNWDVLFSAFEDNDADFVSSHIEFFKDGKNHRWQWWRTLSFAEGYEVEMKNWVKSFNPVYRISAKALDFLDSYLKIEGNEGFYEVIMSTPLYNNGFKIADFGGIGEFVPEGFRNRFYVQCRGRDCCTMRFRPEFTAEEIEALGTKNRFFHPIKHEFCE